MLPAPRIEAVLPTLLEFVGDAVDRRPQRPLRPRLPRRPRSSAPSGPASTNRSIDTCALARRLVRDEVPNCRLGTLADAAAASTTSPATGPSTTRSPPPTCCTCCSSGPAGLGVTGLDDLLALPTIGRPRRRPPSSRSPTALPRAPGVYLFRDRPRPGALRRQGHQPAVPGALVLLRRRPPEGRRSCCARPQRIDHERVRHHARGRGARGPADPRAPAPLQPPGQGLAALRLPQAHARRAVPAAVGRARRPSDDGALYLGPLPSHRGRPAGGRGHRDGGAAAALHGHGPARTPRDRRRARRPSSAWPRARAPATIDAGGLRRRSSTGPSAGCADDPTLLLEPLARAHARAGRASERFEEAADVRDRAAALAQALRRQRRFDALVGGPVGVRRSRSTAPGGAELRRRPAAAGPWRGRADGADAPTGPSCRSTTRAGRPAGRRRRPPAARPPPCRASWPTSWRAWPPGSTARPAASRLRQHASAGWPPPLPRVPSFEPATRRRSPAGATRATAQPSPRRRSRPPEAGRTR